MLIKNSENCIFKTKGAWNIRNKFTNSVLSLILIVLALLFTGCAAEAAGTSSGTPPRGEDTGTSVVSEEREDGQAAEDVATTSSKAAESVPSAERPGPLSSVEGFSTTSECTPESMAPETEQAMLADLVERFKDKENITLSELTVEGYLPLGKQSEHPGARENLKRMVDDSLTNMPTVEE